MPRKRNPIKPIKKLKASQVIAAVLEQSRQRCEVAKDNRTVAKKQQSKGDANNAKHR